MIKIVFSDIDGCFGNFVKPAFPLKQSVAGHEDDLRRIREKISCFSGTQFGVATGRSYYHADTLMEGSAHLGPSLFEMGNMVLMPGKDLVKLVMLQKNNGFENFFQWRKEMEMHEEEIMKRFPGTGVRQMKDRICMLTYEFDRNIGPELFSYVQQLMPSSVKKGLESKHLQVLFCDCAIDILPQVSKKDAVEYLLRRCKLHREEALAIGDSSHSDLALLEGAGKVACPANADDGLKKYVLSRGGYVSPFPLVDGYLDILNHFQKKGELHEA